MSQSEDCRRNAGEDDLRRFPELRRWVRECPACHRRGCRPDLPEQLGETLKAQNIRRYFDPMETDESGFCTTCSRLQRRQKSPNEN